jgi:endonuclease YncB( thermonuclease family)
MLPGMRAFVLLSILATLVAGCGQPSKPKTTKPKAAAQARTAVPAKSQAAAAAPRPAVPARPATPAAAPATPRAIPPAKPAAAPVTDVPRYSPLDEIASMAPEAAARPAPARPAAVEPPAAERWLVVSVHDGDTVLCLDRDNAQRKVRLVGIDAPEIGQPFGTKSRDGLRALVLRKSVLVHEHGEDRYGRTLGSLEVDGGDVALLMLSSGLAWQFTRYSDDEVLAAAEDEARAARRGLWADREPVPPWDWRATERERKAAARQPTGG